MCHILCCNASHLVLQCVTSCVTSSNLPKQSFTGHAEMLNVMFVNGRKTFNKLFSTKLSAYTLITVDKLSFVENLGILE